MSIIGSIFAHDINFYKENWFNKKKRQSEENLNSFKAQVFLKTFLLSF